MCFWENWCNRRKESRLHYAYAGRSVPVPSMQHTIRQLVGLEGRNEGAVETATVREQGVRLPVLNYASRATLLMSNKQTACAKSQNDKLRLTMTRLLLVVFKQHATTNMFRTCRRRPMLATLPKLWPTNMNDSTFSSTTLASFTRVVIANLLLLLFFRYKQRHCPGQKVCNIKSGSRQHTQHFILDSIDFHHVQEILLTSQM